MTPRGKKTTARRPLRLSPAQLRRVRIAGIVICSVIAGGALLFLWPEGGKGPTPANVSALAALFVFGGAALLVSSQGSGARAFLRHPKAGLAREWRRAFHPDAADGAPRPWPLRLLKATGRGILRVMRGIFGFIVTSLLTALTVFAFQVREPWRTLSDVALGLGVVAIWVWIVVDYRNRRHRKRDRAEPVTTTRPVEKPKAET